MNRCFWGTCGLVLVVLGRTAWATDFFIRFDERVPASEKARLLESIQAERLRTVPSLGGGYEVWRSGDDAAKVKQTLDADTRVSVHDRITGDYRDLFTDLSPSMDLAPQIARNLDAIRKQPTTKEVRVVHVKSPALTSSMLLNGFGETDGFARSGTIRLNLFPGVNVVTVMDSVRSHGENKIEWSGSVLRMAEEPAEANAPPRGTAMLSVSSDSVIGRVTIDREIFRITPLGSGFHAISKIDPSKFPPEHPPSQLRIEREQKPALKPRSEGGDASVVLRNADGSLNDLAPTPVVTVGVAYTKGAIQGLGAQTIQEFSHALVRVTNKSYANSRVRAKLLLVGTMAIDYQESNWDSDLRAVVEGKSAPFADLHTWRNRIGANIVVVVVNLEGACGLASAILASVELAYALVHRVCALDNLSFAHEIGHLHGARHDHDKAAKPYPYGHGYAYEGYWRTIMAYPGTCGCNREPYWANPNVRLNGVPMGTAHWNHDARVLTETAPVLSAFKP